MAAPLENEAGQQQQQQQQGVDKSRTIPGLNKAAAEGGRPSRSKSGNDLAGSAASATAASAGANGSTVTGMSSVDSPVSGSPPGSSAGNGNGNGNGNSASLPPIAAGPRGEESLSATLERLRLNAQAAKNGAQSGGAGAIGSRGGDGRGPAPNSRLAKASLPAGANGVSNPAAAAALARGGSTGSAAGAVPGQNDPQMSNFLFDDELDNELHSSTYGGRYLQMNADDDKFPVLIRRDSFPGINQSRNAFMQEHGGRTSEWPQFIGSGATNTASTATTQKANTGSNTPTGGAAAPSGPANVPSNRMSADMSSVVNGARRGEASPRGRQLPPPRSATTGTSPNSAAAGQGSAPLSATTANSASNGPSSAATPTSTAPTATNGTAPGSERSSPSLGDLPGGSPKKAAAGLNGSSSPEEMKRKAQLIRERERLNSAANGPNPMNAAAHQPGHKFSDGTPSPAAKYANELAALNGTFSPYPLESRNGYNGPGEQGYGGGYGGQFPGRRGPNGPNGQQGQRGKEEPNRFAGLRLEDLQGDMAALCKDQHGCRFLQKKLEEGNAEHRDMIFSEIYPHFGELMTDSFGNYLSQKLLEHCSDEQRDALLESISGELVSISLNMHGTRAVQKMIDYLSTQRQVQSLIMALNLNVVTLIKDLNGNHVIQKCLNTLPPEDNQFIYNAVAANCIEVATHRHGCCVLQRCIDHASESQRIQLVTEITYNSLTLVLDPFGNYVVQYVLDLNDSRFITAIVNQFRNNVCALSAQKFSSNVVEKCVRVADLEGRKQLISELIDKSRLERMLRDSFANYVVQTALDYAEPGQRAELVAIIRPVLPMIRNTPYGKRIQSKIQREGFQDGYGRGGWHHHPGMYGPPMGYYGMPPYGPPQHGGPHGPQHQGGPHNGPHGGYHPAGPGGGHYYGPPQGGNEGHMGRGGGPYGHQPQHMQPPHMASPAVSHAFSPSFGPANPAVPMEYPQAQNYNYL